MNALFNVVCFKAHLLSFFVLLLFCSCADMYSELDEELDISDNSSSSSSSPVKESTFSKFSLPACGVPVGRGLGITLGSPVTAIVCVTQRFIF